MGLKNNTRGLFEWIVQRTSAVLIGAYAIFLLCFFATHHPLHYPEWSQLFSSVTMRIITILVVLAILWHAWIGLWTVFTDYVKCGCVRLLLQIAVILLLISYFLWCLDAFWG